MYRYLNFSLRVLMPFAYGDKRRLTPRVHAQYLAPFRTRCGARNGALDASALAARLARALRERCGRTRERLAAIPSLVLWGTRDRAFPAEFLERWRQALPQARIEALSDAGHWPHEECPELVLEAMQRFLTKRDAEG